MISEFAFFKSYIHRYLDNNAPRNEGRYTNFVT